MCSSDLFEEILRGTLGSIRVEVEARAELRGEVTVLIGGAPETAAIEPMTLDDEIRAGRAAGRGLKELAAEIARRTGLSARDVYRRALTLEGR